MNLSISANYSTHMPNQNFLFGDATKAEGERNIDVKPACSVSISREGMNKLKNSSSGKTMGVEKIKQYTKVLSKSQIDVVGTIESDFHHRYTRLNTENVSDEAEYDAKAEGFASNLISSYAEMYDEIKKGYEEGTREIYIPDADAEFGYRKATEEEEIAALDAAFDFHVQYTDGYLRFLREDKDIMELDIQTTQEQWQAAREHRDAKAIEARYHERLEKIREKIENTKPININQIMGESREYFKAQYNSHKDDITAIMDNRWGRRR